MNDSHKNENLKPRWDLQPEQMKEAMLLSGGCWGGAALFSYCQVASKGHCLDMEHVRMGHVPEENSCRKL